MAVAIAVDRCAPLSGDWFVSHWSRPTASVSTVTAFAAACAEPASLARQNMIRGWILMLLLRDSSIGVSGWLCCSVRRLQRR
jgi:hypothetical protein